MYVCVLAKLSFDSVCSHRISEVANNHVFISNSCFRLAVFLDNSELPS